MKKALILFMAALLPQAISCYKNPASGRSELMLISYSTEKELGRSARKDIEKQYGGVVNDEKLNNYVNSVGQKIADTIRKKVRSKGSDQEVDYEYKVVNSKILNAFALPGGYIYITRGLLSKLQNEAQLAGVLGHESGHAVGRHTAEQISKELVMSTLLGAGIAYTESRDTKNARKNAETVSIVGNIVGDLIILGYSRDHETEADELGTQFIHDTGYNPLGMVGVLEVLQKESKGGESSIMEIFQTHPNTKKRIADVEKEIRQKYPNMDNEKLAFGEAPFMQGTETLRIHSAYAMYDRADKARKEGKPGAVDTALTDMNAAINEKKDEPSFYVERAMLYERNRDYKKAQKDYEMALELDSENFEALVGLGVERAHDGSYQDATKLLEHATIASPGNAEGHYWLGEIYDKLGKASDARAEYIAVLQIAQSSPNNKDAQDFANKVREKGITNQAGPGTNPPPNRRRRW